MNWATNRFRRSTATELLAGPKGKSRMVVATFFAHTKYTQSLAAKN